jgi:hypothetical protein
MTTNYTVLVLEQIVKEFFTWKNSLLKLQHEFTCHGLKLTITERSFCNSYGDESLFTPSGTNRRRRI